MAYKPTLSDAQEVVNSNGYTPTLADIHQGLQPSSKKTSALKALLAGAGQGLTDTAISAINAADIGGNKVNQLMGGHAPVVPMIQHPDIAGKFGVDKSQHPIAGILGNVAGGSIIPGGAYVKGIKLLPEATGLLKALPRAISGAASGALTGEDDSGNRLAATLGGGALGAGGGAIGDAITPSKKLVDQIAQRAIQKKGIGSEKYQAVLNPHANTPVMAPRVDEELLADLGPDERVSIGKMIAHPTVMNAHEAQSDLNKYINDMTKLNARAGTSVSRKNLQEALRLKQNIRNSISEGFKNSGQEGLGKAYQGATEYWAKEVVPYLNNKPLQKYMAGKVSPGFALKRMAGGSEAADVFAKSVGHENPELSAFKSNAKLKNTLGKIAFYSAIASSIPGIEHLKEVL